MNHPDSPPEEDRKAFALKKATSAENTSLYSSSKVSQDSRREVFELNPPRISLVKSLGRDSLQSLSPPSQAQPERESKHHFKAEESRFSFDSQSISS